MARRIARSMQALIAVCDLAIRPLPVAVASELAARLMRGLGPRLIQSGKMRHNFAVAFPELDPPALDARVREALGHFGRLIAEIAKIDDFRHERNGAELRLHGEMPAPLGPLGNAIFVGAHLGNWELVPILLQHHGLSLTIVQTPIGHAAIDRRLMRWRARTGATYVEKSGALRACAAALKRGGSLALLVDPRVKQGIDAVFFGHRTRFTHFPARMARRFGCPIVVMDSWRSAPGRVEVAFAEPIRPEEFAGPDAERQMTQRMVSAMEATIRRHPEQWFCHKRRFSKRELRQEARAARDGGAQAAGQTARSA